MTENVFWFSSRIDCLTSCISLIVGTKTFSVKNFLTFSKNQKNFQELYLGCLRSDLSNLNFEITQLLITRSIVPTKIAKLQN